MVEFLVEVHIASAPVQFQEARGSAVVLDALAGIEAVPGNIEGSIL